MSLVYVVLINVILIFIVFVVLNHKINKHSTSALLDRYAREVESLIVELNRSIDDVLNLSEERVKELKRLLRRAEKVLNDPVARKALAAGDESGGWAARSGAAVYDERGRRAASTPPTDTSGAPKASVGAAGDDREGSPKKSRGEPAGQNPAVEGPAEPASSGPGRATRGAAERENAPAVPAGESRRVNMLERTRHLLSMGHSKEEIAGILGISRAEIDFLVSLQNK